MTLKEILLDACAKLEQDDKSQSGKLRLMASLAELAETARNDDLVITDEDLLCIPQSIRQIAILGFATISMMALHTTD